MCANDFSDEYFNDTRSTFRVQADHGLFYNKLTNTTAESNKFLADNYAFEVIDYNEHVVQGLLSNGLRTLKADGQVSLILAFPTPNFELAHFRQCDIRVMADSP